MPTICLQHMYTWCYYFWLTLCNSHVSNVWPRSLVAEPSLWSLMQHLFSQCTWWVRHIQHSISIIGQHTQHCTNTAGQTYMLIILWVKISNKIYEPWVKHAEHSIYIVCQTYPTWYSHCESNIPNMVFTLWVKHTRHGIYTVGQTYPTWYLHCGSNTVGNVSGSGSALSSSFTRVDNFSSSTPLT